MAEQNETHLMAFHVSLAGRASASGVPGFACKQYARTAVVSLTGLDNDPIPDRDNPIKPGEMFFRPCVSLTKDPDGSTWIVLRDWDPTANSPVVYRVSASDAETEAQDLRYAVDPANAKGWHSNPSTTLAGFLTEFGHLAPIAEWGSKPHRKRALLESQIRGLEEDLFRLGKRVAADESAVARAEGLLESTEDEDEKAFERKRLAKDRALLATSREKQDKSERDLRALREKLTIENELSG